MHTNLPDSHQIKNKHSDPSSDIYKFTYHDRNLKTSIQKKLLLRLVIACLLISIIIASTVFSLEIHRLGRMVNSRASEMAERFNDEVRHLLKGPILKGKKELRDKLKLLSIVGKHNLGIGHIIYAGIYDNAGKPVFIEKDSECPYLDKVEAVMSSFDHQQIKNSRKVYKYKNINGNPHIQLIYPLTNSKKDQVGYIKGLFAVSSKERDEVINRIARTTLEAVGIVVLTTIILYPIITTLIRRLSKLAHNLMEANIETLSVLGGAIAKRDSDTDIHNYRVTIYSVTLAEALGLDHYSIRTLIKGAFLHDVGKIGISDDILLKHGKLMENEFEIMKLHVDHGADIVAGSNWLKDAIDIVGYHHEKFDGSGYPHGLKGNSIPITARIFAVADVFDALTSNRPYKASISFQDAIEMLKDGRGTHFDPFVLDTFMTIAAPLFEKVSNYSEDMLRNDLESFTRKYFLDNKFSGN